MAGVARTIAGRMLARLDRRRPRTVEEAEGDRDEPRFERTLDEEVARITTALVEYGPLHRDVLADKSGARRWGPGRFADALREAELEGHIERLSEDRFARPARHSTTGR